MIFNLFKSKPNLKELIPEGFVDIHSHILPGIDDGAKNVEESMELISEMEKLGFSKIIGTPHSYPGLYENSNESIKESFLILNKKNSTNINICYASEYMIDIQIIEKAEKKKLLCLKDNLILVETSFSSMPLNFYDIIFKLQINGYLPILAHPERYTYLQDKKKLYFELKKRGCKFQLNLLSVTGYYGKKCVEACDFLIKNDMIDYVGSDIHNLSHVKTFENSVVIKEHNKLNNIINKNFYFKN